MPGIRRRGERRVDRLPHVAGRIERRIVPERAGVLRRGAGVAALTERLVQPADPGGAPKSPSTWSQKFVFPCDVVLIEPVASATAS